MQFFPTFKKSVVLASSLSAALLLASCGGDGSSGTGEIKTGVFLDSAVEGLTYTSGSTTGKTDAAGTFKYEDGKAVNFKVGDISLATLYGKALITPVDLVSGASDETNATVTNIAIFLQSIDDDNNTANGIKISSAVDTAAKNKVLTFTNTTETFTTDSGIAQTFKTLTAATSAGEHAMVTDVNAKAHLKVTLLARFIGKYDGTYTGGASGSFSITADSAGALTGAARPNATDSIAITGTVASNGTVTFTSAAGMTFTGKIVPDTGALSGTWTVTGSSSTGSFTGKK